MSFLDIFNPLSIFSRFNSNTDLYTRPVNTVSYRLFDFSVDKKHEEYVTISNDEYLLYSTTPEVHLVIKKGAELFSNGRWKIINDDGEEVDGEEAGNVLNLLNSPNIFQSAKDFLMDVYMHRALYGNTFTYMNFAPGAEIPATLVNLLPRMIVMNRTGKYIKQISADNIIESYYLKDRAGRVVDVFETKEIIHWKCINPDDPLFGRSPLNSLHMPISNIRAARGYVNADYTKKGAHGMISSESKDAGGSLPLTERDRIALERQYSEVTHGSSDFQSKVLVSEKPIKWTLFPAKLRTT